MKILALFSVFLLIGCSIGVVYTVQDAEERSVIRSYQIGEFITQSVGERMIYKKTEVDMLGDVPSEMHETVESYNKLVLVDTFSPADSFTLETYNGNLKFVKGKKYFSAFKMEGLSLIQTQLKMGNRMQMIYLPIDNSGYVSGDTFYYSRTSVYPELFFGDELKSVKSHYKFSFDNDNRNYRFLSLGKTLNPLDYKTNINFFEQDIVYMGVDGDNIKILYREYFTQINRPGFSIELEYDLSDKNIINYKNFSIEILSATQHSIQYKVLSD